MLYPNLLHPSPCPCGRPLLTRTFAGDTQAQFWPSLCSVSGSWCTQGLFEPSEHLWQERSLILNTILPLLPSCLGFPFALGHGVSFFGGIQHSPVEGCSAASCSFRGLTGEDEHTSFYSTILKVTIHMDITRWSIFKSDWLYSLQPKMEKLYTVIRNMTRS